MATVDLVVVPTANYPIRYEFPLPGGLNTNVPYLAVNEGTAVDSSFSVLINISAAQATDTVVALGVFGLRHRNPGPGQPLLFEGPVVGALADQYDIPSNLTFVIPAGMTGITASISIGADSQPEYDELFRLYVVSVSDGNVISAEDQLNFNASPRPEDYNNVVGIIDDDASNGFFVLSRGSDSYYIQESNTQPVMAGAGNDMVHGSVKADTILLHEGDDNSYGYGGADNIHGGAGDDRINGGDDGDIIFGGHDDDFISGDLGDDVLWGDGVSDNDGSDVIYGGFGRDTILGQGGADTLYGNEDADAISGGYGNDTMMGDDGNDILFGGGGDDTMHGGNGNDIIWGEDDTGSPAGNDAITGGEGNDTILGQGGNEVIFGDGGDDAMSGGAGNDILYGHSGADILFGDENNDLLWGGSGNDLLKGGLGSDLFMYQNGDGIDTILDFNANGDRDGIDLRGYFDAIGYAGAAPRSAGLLWINQNDADAHVYVSGQLALIITNVTAAALDDSYFLFQ